MALPTAGPYGSPVIDDFNRAGATSPPSASWTTGFNPTSGALALSNDSATVKANVAGFCDSYRNDANHGPNCEVWCVASALATASDELFAIYLRGTPGASATAYEVSINAATAGNAVVQRENNTSTFPTLATIPLPNTYAANDGLALAAFGTVSPVTLEVWHWDDSLASGWAYAGTAMDNFSVQAPGSQAPFLGAGRVALEMQNTTSRVTVFGGGTIFVPQQAVYAAAPMKALVG